MNSYVNHRRQSREVTTVGKLYPSILAISAIFKSLGVRVMVDYRQVVTFVSVRTCRNKFAKHYCKINKIIDGDGAHFAAGNQWNASICIAPEFIIKK